MNMILSSLVDLLQESTSVYLLFLLACKATIVLTAALALHYTLRRTSAAVRHMMWGGVFVCLLILPVASVLIPVWEIPLLPDAIEQCSSEAAAPPQDMKPGAAAPIAALELSSGLNTSEPPNVADSNYYETENTAYDLLPLAGLALAVIWLFGCIFGLARLAVDVILVKRIQSGSKIAANASWDAIKNEICAYLNVDVAIEVRLGRAVPMPMTYGLLKPVILLPAAAENWPLARRRSVLLHETAHIKRRDYATNLLAGIVGAVYWFHPLVHIAQSHMKQTREHACDDYVIRSGVGNCDYAEHLLAIAAATGRKQQALQTALAMSEKEKLRGRLEHIISNNVARSAVSRRGMMLAAIATALILIPVSQVHLKGGAFLGAQEASVVVLLKPQDEAAVRALISDLQSGEVDRQKKAAWELGCRETILGVEPLIATLTARDPEVRAMSAWALGEIKDQRAIAPLLGLLKDDDIYVREMAVRALGELENAQATAALTRLVKDKNADLRYAAVWALGEIATPQSLEAITSALQDTSPDVRDMAVDVLSQYRGKEVLAFLKPMLQDKNNSVRRHAVEVLGELRDAEAIAVILPLLGDPDGHVKEAAILALGKIGHDRAVEPLMALLRDQQPAIRSAAVWALDEIVVK